MTLEAVVICIDSSAFSRDGDPAPSRLVAQRDAAEVVANAYLNQHRDNAVALLAMGGVEGARVCASPTNEFAKLHSVLHAVESGGIADFVRGLLVAQLVLKHRQHKNQRQRILLFVGSPVATPEKQLVQLARQLKKNNVALDIVLLSNHDENRGKLEAMHAAVNSNNSRFIEYDASGGRILSEHVMSALRVQDPDAANATEGGAGANEFEIDANEDPELLMVLRMSLQEAQQQQQQQNAAAGTAGQATTEPEGLEEMDEELRQAVLLSLQDFAGGDSAASAPEVGNNASEQQQQQPPPEDGGGQAS